MKPREPLWTLKELADHTKVAINTIRNRMQKSPIQTSGAIDGEFDSRFSTHRSQSTARYPKSALLNWFKMQDAETPFNRKA